MSCYTRKTRDPLRMTEKMSRHFSDGKMTHWYRLDKRRHILIAFIMPANWTILSFLTLKDMVLKIGWVWVGLDLASASSNSSHPLIYNFTYMADSFLFKFFLYSFIIFCLERVWGLFDNFWVSFWTSKLTFFKIHWYNL